MSVFFINPFLGAAGGDFESIATVTLSSAARDIEFTSIPGTYQHLQIRLLTKSVITQGDVGDMTFNSDTGNNYAYHSLYGDGASAAAEAGTTRANIPLARMVTLSSTSVFGANIVDILDYASTSKYKTVRTLKGDDRNGSGAVLIDSGLWMSSSAITSIKFSGRTNNFAQHTTAALYGVKAP